MPEKKIRSYSAEIPFNLTQEDIERLRGLAEVRVTVVIEAETREKAIGMLVEENQGWHATMANWQWWSDRLSRGITVRTEER